MKKYYSLLLLLTLCSCDNIILNSSILDNSSDSIVENESSSSLEIDETSSPSINDETSSSTNNEDSSSSDNVESDNEKNYYKNLVNRELINYSTPLENDLNHDVTALEIFEINDTHGAFYDDSSITGISRVKTCIEANTIDPYSVVKIGNGDLMQGTAFSNMLMGEPAVAALNEMDFDCFVVGNHEFDWNIKNLKDYKDNDLSNGELNCPFLGANIVDASGNRPSFIEPYTIVNKGDVKVGIIGIIGDGFESSISKISLDGYRFTSTTESVKKYSDVLLNQENVDVLIVASHAHDEAKNQQYVNNSKIDCIINAHDHQKINEYVTRYDGKKIPVVESNTKNITIGKVTLNLDNNNNYTSYKTEHFSPKNFDKDANLENIMNVYYQVTSEYEKQVIGYKAGGFSKSAIAISTCNYMAEKYDCDLAFINTGGVRAKVSVSNITNGSIYEVFPFDNELYITSVTGSQLKKMITQSNLDYYYYNESGIGWGTEYDYNGVENNKTYKVITVDYVATKSYMSSYFSSSNPNFIMTGDYVRDCAIENIKKNYKK